MTKEFVITASGVLFHWKKDQVILLSLVKAGHGLPPVTAGIRVLVGWSLTSLFSTNTAVLETKGQGCWVILLTS